MGCVFLFMLFKRYSEEITKETLPVKTEDLLTIYGFQMILYWLYLILEDWLTRWLQADWLQNEESGLNVKQNL